MCRRVQTGEEEIIDSCEGKYRLLLGESTDLFEREYRLVWYLEE